MNLLTSNKSLVWNIWVQGLANYSTLIKSAFIQPPNFLEWMKKMGWLR